MDPYLWEWGSLLLRWLHVVAAMAWIGSSFFFMHLDATLRARDDLPEAVRSAWQVHGGGFYEMRKWAVAPPSLPAHLTWHKWQAYWTWISGALLLVWIYYAQSELYLIDPAVRELSPLAAAAFGLGGIVLGWLIYDGLCRSPLGRNDAALLAALFAYAVAVSAAFAALFSGRGALLHTGAVLATVMTGNVFLVIMPNQKKAVAQLLRGETPDPRFGREGKQRSTHNNYITLPVVFLMLANHYPLTWASQAAIPAVVALTLIAGALVRVFYNRRHAGFDRPAHGNPWWAWGATWGGAAAAVALAAAITIGLGPADPAAERPAARAPGPTAPAVRAEVPPEVEEIVIGRCAMCHMPAPAWAGLGMPPKGVVLDQPEAIAREAYAIRVQAVLSRAMPPGNITGLTEEERRVLGLWAAGR
jgi:uncharacterized membrane protein